MACLINFTLLTIVNFNLIDKHKNLTYVPEPFFIHGYTAPIYLTRLNAGGIR